MPEDFELDKQISYSLILHRLPPRLRLKIISPPADPIDAVQNIYDVISSLIKRRFSDKQINDLMLNSEIGADQKRQNSDFYQDILRVKNTKLGETEIAKQFANINDNFKYCASWGKWLYWNKDKGYWQIDEGMTIISAISDTINDIEIPSIRRSAQLVFGVEKLLRSEEKVLTYDSDWDSNLWEINTPNGTVDLKTGTLRPSFKSDLHTKITTTSPNRRKSIRLWLRFLLQVTGKDKDYIRYLQRISGYCLTGLTNEHALFFLYGPGGNGKGVFLNTITKILGDYASIADMSLFTESKYEQHSTGLASLRGARLVTSQETEGGKSWKESLIKTLTSDDPITARFMRQDFFTFRKQCKLLISGNHEPQLRNVDDAIRRRFNKLPFTFQPNKPDKNLLEKLEKEHEGIFYWMLEGCKQWQKQGLNPPQIVIDATRKYMSDQYNFQHFLDEECDIFEKDLEKDPTLKIGPVYHEGSLALFDRWCSWASKRHLPRGSIKTFTPELEKHGFKHKEKIPGLRISGYEGLKLSEGSKKKDENKTGEEKAKKALEDLDKV